MSKKELDKNLRYFYAEARTRGGALYSRSSLLGLRNAIERYLNNPPFNRGISITKGTEFQSSNKLLQSMIKLNKRENNENTKHKTQNTNLPSQQQTFKSWSRQIQSGETVLWVFYEMSGLTSACTGVVEDAKVNDNWRSKASSSCLTIMDGNTLQWPMTRLLRTIQEGLKTSPV